jgi:hypothetical protein
MAILFAPLLIGRTCVAVICGMVVVINGNNHRSVLGGASGQDGSIGLIEPDDSDQRQTAGNHPHPLEHGGRISG